MRRFQVLVESEFPTELGNTFRNLEKAGNPWGANRVPTEMLGLKRLIFQLR